MRRCKRKVSEKKILRLELGGKARRYYLLGLVIIGLLMPLFVWLYHNGSKLLAVLGFVIFLDALLALPRSRRWARPLELRGERLCRHDGCRDLAELAAARFEVRNAALLANMREGAIALEWQNGEVWRVPLSLCGWHELWERIRQLRPELELGDWREDETLRRILRHAWDMPFCAPRDAEATLLTPGDWAWFLLAAATIGIFAGIVGGLLRVRPGFSSAWDWFGGFLSILVALRIMRWRLSSRSDAGREVP